MYMGRHGLDLKEGLEDSLLLSWTLFLMNLRAYLKLSSSHNS